MNEKTRTLTREEIEDIRNRLITRGSVLTDEEAIVLCDMALSAPSQAVTEGMIAELDSMQGELAWYHKKITGTDSAGKLWAESFKDELREYHKTLTAALRSAPPSSQQQSDIGHGERRQGAYRLVYNKATKRIDRVRNSDGLTVDSFDPPTECREEHETGGGNET